MNASSTHVCPVERAGALDVKIRKLAHNPSRLLKPYIKEDMKIMDFGCGPGFFSIEMAKMVSDLGKIIAVDLQKGVLEKLNNKGVEISYYVDIERIVK